MSSQPNESPAEDIRNALQLLMEPQRQFPVRDGEVTSYWMQDVEAIRARLEAALAKLEAPRFARITQQDMGGAASEPPLDYERPGQVDPMLRGQEITEDGE